MRSVANLSLNYYIIIIRLCQEKRGQMLKQKLKAVLKFLFVIIPFLIANGLEIIILHNKDIDSWGFTLKNIQKPKIDKQKGKSI